ncbi:hypothetical protein [Cellulomonas hominis]
MNTSRILAWGSLVGLAAAATAATISDSGSVDVHFDRASGFDLMVVGDADPTWVPTDAAWSQGNPDAFRIALTADGSQAQIGPGGELTFRVAARNSSSATAALVGLTIFDPESHSGETDADGRFVELYDQIAVTVTEGTTVLIDDVPGPVLASTPYAWPQEWAPGEAHLLDVTVRVPYEIDNSWQGAHTDLQIQFDAENA